MRLLGVRAAAFKCTALNTFQKKVFELDLVKEKKNKKMRLMKNEFENQYEKKLWFIFDQLSGQSCTPIPRIAHILVPRKKSRYAKIALVGLY